MTHQSDMVIGTLHLRLILRASRSLKDKRRTVKSIKDRIRNKFNASIAEVAALDNCQTAVLGVAVVANDPAYVHSVLSAITNLVAMARDAELAGCDTEIL